MSAEVYSETELEQIYRRATADLPLVDRPYPRPLPPDVGRWHCDLADAGHSVLCVLARDLPGIDWTQPWQDLVPVPVKSALRGYEVLRGLLVVDLPYDEDLGLLTPPEDEEP